MKRPRFTNSQILAGLKREPLGLLGPRSELVPGVDEPLELLGPRSELVCNRPVSTVCH